MLSVSEIDQLRRAHAIEDMQTFDWAPATLTGAEVPQDILICHMSGNTFLFLGVRPLLGRYLLPSDAPENGEAQPVALLNYTFWQRYYNYDPGVVGKHIELDQRSYTIIGVMPPGINWQGPDIWLPLKMAADANSKYQVVIRLRKGVTPVAATAELTPLYAQFDKERPEQQHLPSQFHVNVETITQYYVRTLGGTLNLLFDGVLVLLAIGCANLSILLLARGVDRESEFAVRAAVGANRARIVRQLLTESLLLALTGTFLGILFSYEAVRLIVARLPEQSFALEADFHVHVPILLFSAGLAILSGALFGIVPALELSRPQLSAAMQARPHNVAGRARGRRIHAGLIAAQIALALVLLSAAGAAIEGFSRMMLRPLGYNPRGVMSVSIPIGRNALPSWAERTAYFQHLLERIEATPGIVSAAISGGATPPSNGLTMPVDILGKTPLEQQEAKANLASPEYFATLNIPLIEGRLWSRSEVAEAEKLVIVNKTFVRRYFPDQDAIGQSVRFPKMTARPPFVLAAPGSNDWLQIIGVVDDAVNDGLDKPITSAVYAPYTLLAWGGTEILVRTRGNPLAMLPSVRRQITGLNPSQGIWWRVNDLETWIRQEPEYARTQLFSILFGAFAGLGLLLSAMGLYSVMAYSVVRRTREFGIRMALGAKRGHVLGFVARSGALSVGIGVVTGCALSLVLRRLIARLVGDAATDPGIAFAGSAIMIFVAAVACVLPALRAASVNPISALRTE